MSPDPAPTRLRIYHHPPTGMPVVAVPDLITLVTNMLTDTDCDQLRALHGALVLVLSEAIAHGPT